MKVLNIVGARPNFMKVAPLHAAFQQFPHIESKIVHTGQHYDERMSDIFFNQLQLPQPDYYLGIGSGSHAWVTGRIMIEFEKIVQAEQPDLVLVVGDVNSTLACSLVAKKLNILLAHVEAGLRSNDRKMPEELNRILTDTIADLLFVTERSGMVNLAQEGIPKEKFFFVGNVMIDSLHKYRLQARGLNNLKDLNLIPGDYILTTMHRPANVDQPENLRQVLNILKEVSNRKRLVFPMHPRSRKRFKQFGLMDELSSIPNLVLLEPQGYLEFLNLMQHAALILTDSGGIQEESTYLKVPCLTLRNSTERPITIELGTNLLIEQLDIAIILDKIDNILRGNHKRGEIPPLWDGQAANRIVHLIHDQWIAQSQVSSKLVS